MPLKHRDAPGGGWPNQGYLFFQPQTNWWSSPGFGFWQTVDDIIAHRLKNPRFASQWTTNRNEVADELDLFTCLRLNYDPQWCTGGAADVKKKTGRQAPNSPQNLPRQLAANAAAAVTRAENAAAGVGVVLDWLGDSLEPVALDLAEKRAAVCAGCPQNGRPDFFQKLLGMAASGVKQLIELKNDLELKTSVDDKLKYCGACDCVITLKVHAPMAHIKAHTRDEVKAKLDPRCWMLKEWDEA